MPIPERSLERDLDLGIFLTGSCIYLSEKAGTSIPPVLFQVMLNRVHDRGILDKLQDKFQKWQFARLPQRLRYDSDQSYSVKRSKFFSIYLKKKTISYNSIS